MTLPAISIRNVLGPAATQVAREMVTETDVGGTFGTIGISAGITGSTVLPASTFSPGLDILPILSCGGAPLMSVPFFDSTGTDGASSDTSRAIVLPTRALSPGLGNSSRRSE